MKEALITWSPAMTFFDSKCLIVEIDFKNIKTFGNKIRHWKHSSEGNWKKREIGKLGVRKCPFKL